MELTTTQIAALVGKTERTVQRWIRDGKIKASTSPNGRIQISEDELQALADQSAQAEEIAELRNRVELLETRVDELEKWSKGEHGRKPAVKPSTAPAVPAEKTELSLGSTLAESSTISARRFAEMHNMSRDKMAGWIERGQIAATAVPFGQRSQYQLTPEQQSAAIVFWREASIPFEPCVNCPHDHEESAKSSQALRGS